MSYKTNKNILEILDSSTIDNIHIRKYILSIYESVYLI